MIIPGSVDHYWKKQKIRVHETEFIRTL
jgi:hypothetical protein